MNLAVTSSLAIKSLVAQAHTIEAEEEDRGVL